MIKKWKKNMDLEALREANRLAYKLENLRAMQNRLMYMAPDEGCEVHIDGDIGYACIEIPASMLISIINEEITKVELKLEDYGVVLNPPSDAEDNNPAMED